MTKYLEESFNSPANNKNYSNNYDSVFEKRHFVCSIGKKDSEGPFTFGEAKALAEKYESACVAVFIYEEVPDETT